MSDSKSLLKDLKAIIQRKAEYAATLDECEKKRTLISIEIELKVLRNISEYINEQNELNIMDQQGSEEIVLRLKNDIEKLELICFMHGISDLKSLMIWSLYGLVERFKEECCDEKGNQIKVITPLALNKELNG